MNYARIRQKLKEKNKELRAMDSETRAKSEKMIIEQAKAEEQAEEVNETEELNEEVKQGNKRGPKPRR